MDNIEAFTDVEEEDEPNYSECFNSFHEREGYFALICGACTFFPGEGDSIGGMCYWNKNIPLEYEKTHVVSVLLYNGVGLPCHLHVYNWDFEFILHETSH